MTPAQRLLDVVVPARPDGLVLVLHGGASRGANAAVSPTQLSVLRMQPIARRVARAGAGRLAVFRVLNAHRGWDPDQSPVEDATWALEQAAARVGGDVPACLIGHSLGGRAALLSAGLPAVRSVVALAPWVYATDRVPDIDGKRILFVHGSADRVASPQRSRALADALSAHADVAYVTVRGGKHAMLARRRVFEGLAAEFAALTLLGHSADPTLAHIERGELRLEI